MAGCVAVLFAYETSFYVQVAMHESMAAARAAPKSENPLFFHGQHLNSAGSDAESHVPANASTVMDASATWNDTRGVVLCLHDGVLAMGVSLIRELRCLGNTEVIQVYHCLSELSAQSIELLQRNDPHVDVIDVCTELMDSGVFHVELFVKTFQSYWLKPLALYYTNLTEVILMDADAILMRNPADLRSVAGYQRTGTLFFYDRVATFRKFFNRLVLTQPANGEEPSRLQLLQLLIDTFPYGDFNLTGPNPSQQLLRSMAYAQLTSHEQDSSLLLVDKSRAGKAMDVLAYLISNVRFEHNFSWGDKESFWLSFELAHQPYYFSPFGLSLVDSVPNEDLKLHPDTMCGSMAHFLPPVYSEVDASAPELLYLNAKALLEPFPTGLEKNVTKRSRMYNLNPTHVTPRHRREEYIEKKARKGFECINDMGSTPLPPLFRRLLMRRRVHFLAVATSFYEPLDTCVV
ncbi:TPA: hypothetical protein N0F65_008850 [Lagenidium giganteum]|uniref:Nucleotide-diphospho-sugar transferase n=1 Tax=Lagenidium giganteum TaxID=4803 RepID=A0AAV2YUG6_9STRA|nr:TPA: hypothetical protein N0F65_008850 [Lagenidium giganteum]